MVREKADDSNKKNSSINLALPEHSSHIRVDRELLLATEPFAHESVVKSWWLVGTTFTLMITALVCAGMAPWWPIRLLCSVLSGLFMVRAFITYHDYIYANHVWPGYCLDSMEPLLLVLHVRGARATIIITVM